MLEVNTVDLLGLDTGRDVGGINLQGCQSVFVVGTRNGLNCSHLEHAVFAGLLLGEDFKSLRRISGSDNTIRNLARDDTGCGDVARSGKSDEIAERGHAVSACKSFVSRDFPIEMRLEPTTSTSIGSSQRRKGLLEVIDSVDLLLRFVELNPNSGASRGNVLERGSSGQAESVLQFLDQRVGVESIEQVDVPGGTTEGWGRSIYGSSHYTDRWLTLERKFALGHESLSRLLVGVGTISKGDALDRASELLLRKVSRCVVFTEVTADGIVVLRRLLKGLESEIASSGLVNASLLPRVQELCVILRVRQDRDASVVLSSSTEESHTADVDLFDGIGQSAVRLGDGLVERVQVAHDNGNGRDSLSFEILLIGRDVASEDTWESSNVSMIPRNCCFAKYLREPPGGESSLVLRAFREPS